MKSEPLSPVRVLDALERFGPQARPYNFDDHFDCWGLAQRVFDWLDDGYDLDRDALDETTAGNWLPIGERGELVPGDLLATHPQPDPAYHVVFFCGRVGDADLVYDSSPRGAVPLFDDRLRLTGERRVHTRYSRATETTERLRDDGGAYLRLWHDKMRYYHAGLHERLVAGGAAGERDLVALRRAAGLSDLPFYCRRRLPTDAAGRELYDNLATRHLDYYVPDAAPVPDDRYDEVFGGAHAPGGARSPGGSSSLVPPFDLRRPPAPEITGAPEWIAGPGRLEVAWAYGDGADDPPVRGRRVELWEETHDIWRHRLLRADTREPDTAFTVPKGLLAADSRYAVVVYALGDAGYSAGAVAPFLYRPAPGNPLLGYNPVRARGLQPDGRQPVPAAEDVALKWCVPRPSRDQVSVDVAVFEGGTCLREDAEPVFECSIWDAAAGCSCLVPAAVLQPGHDYYWYVTPSDVAGHQACASAEGVFSVTERG
jgi:hypothetical protein